jgi:hypothetical protein
MRTEKRSGRIAFTVAGRAMSTIRLLGLLAATAGSGCSGCGPADEFRHVGVSGKVTLGGKPMTSGTITFVPLASGPAAYGTITDGSYTISRGEGPGPGSYRVEISNIQPTGRRVPDSEYPGKTVEETGNAVPGRYNLNSTLRADVKGARDQTFNFALEAAK